MITRARKGEFGGLRYFSSTFSQNIREEKFARPQRLLGWLDPVHEHLSSQRGAQPFGGEPIEVLAVGTKTPSRDLNFHETMAVTRRFPDKRLAQFTASYATAPSKSCALVGRIAIILASPCFGFSHMEITEEAETEHSIDPVGHSATRRNTFPIASSSTASRRPKASKGCST